MTGFLAAQEEQKKEEARKNLEKQQSAFSSFDKPGSSMKAEPSKMKKDGKEGDFAKEQIRESVKTDPKSVVSFARNLIFSAPKKDEESRLVDPSMSQDRLHERTSFFPEQTYQYAQGDHMMRTNERQNQIQYEQEANEMRYGRGRGMNYNPVTSWGSGQDHYADNTEYTNVPKYNYKVEDRGKVISKFAHKCEKLKDCESIPQFLETLEKSFALSNIESQKGIFRIMDFLIPSSGSAELIKEFSKLEQKSNGSYTKAIEELEKIYEEYFVRCPIKCRLKFSRAAHEEDTIIYEFGKKFIADNNIKPS